MGFVKTNRSEGTKVLSPAQHKAAEDELRRLGKSSAQGLSEGERASLRNSIDKN